MDHPDSGLAAGKGGTQQKHHISQRFYPALCPAGVNLSDDAGMGQEKQTGKAEKSDEIFLVRDVGQGGKLREPLNQKLHSPDYWEKQKQGMGGFGLAQAGRGGQKKEKETASQSGKEADQPAQKVKMAHRWIFRRQLNLRPYFHSTDSGRECHEKGRQQKEFFSVKECAGTDHRRLSPKEQKKSQSHQQGIKPEKNGTPRIKTGERVNKKQLNANPQGNQNQGAQENHSFTRQHSNSSFLPAVWLKNPLK